MTPIHIDVSPDQTFEDHRDSRAACSLFSDMESHRIRPSKTTATRGPHEALSGSVVSPDQTFEDHRDGRPWNLQKR